MHIHHGICMHMTDDAHPHPSLRFSGVPTPLCQRLSCPQLPLQIQVAVVVV